jgi:signal transduction histidine kinase
MTDWVRWLALTSWILMGWAHPIHALAEPLHITTVQWRQEMSDGYGPNPLVLKELGDRDLWQSVSLAHALPRKMLANQKTEKDKANEASILTSITWYKVNIPEQHQWGNGQRYLYIPRLKMDGQITIYADRQLIYQNDALIHWNGANTPKWLALDQNHSSKSLSEIIIRVVHPRGSGGGISSLWLGTHEEINWRYRIRSLLQNELPFAFSSAFLAIGIFGFFIWLKLRDDKGYLMFFGISIASFIRTLHYHVGVTRLPISEAWFTWMTLNSLFWMIWVVNAFLNYLHERPTRLFNRVLTVIVIGVGFVTAPWSATWFNAYQISPLIYLLLLGVGFFGSIYGLKQSMITQSPGGKLLSSWGLLGMAFGSYDLLLQSNLTSIESIYLGPLSNIVAFLILMRIIFDRYMSAIHEVHAVNANLQVRLQAREAELDESHQKLRKIELQRQLSQERQRLMQDMHDGMGSSLRTALLAIEKGQLNAPEMANILKDCIDDLKLTIDSMEPMDADLLLLLATFRYRIGSRLEVAGIALRWDVTSIPKVKGLTPQSTLHILRIFQEAFTNIIKHSGATLITVSTRTLGQHVSVTISDNGQGFAKAIPSNGDGRGMNNQKRRAEFIGATIEWQSRPNGTQMTLTLPTESPIDSDSIGGMP